MRYAISYVSTASPKLSEDGIEEILTRSEDKNNKKGITGLLLFSEGNFFQIIEGEEMRVKSLFQTIKEDQRHHNLIKLFEKPIKKDSFDGYKCDFISENARFDISRLRNYQHYIEVLDNQTKQAVTGILEAFIR